LSSNVSQLYYNGFIPFCVYTTYFTLPPKGPKVIRVSPLMKNNILLFLFSPVSGSFWDFSELEFLTFGLVLFIIFVPEFTNSSFGFII
ncbi:hypothetical protein ABGW24_13185, partial [Lactococcus lactis]